MSKKIKFDFENVLNSNIVISIMAYSINDAWDILTYTVSCTNDYKNINL